MSAHMYHSIHDTVWNKMIRCKGLPSILGKNFFISSLTGFFQI